MNLKYWLRLKRLNFDLRKRTFYLHSRCIKKNNNYANLMELVLKNRVVLIRVTQYRCLFTSTTPPSTSPFLDLEIGVWGIAKDHHKTVYQAGNNHHKYYDPVEKF
ncbi:hypothetical protein ERO13_D02G064450v2 [Gossypium hirsutum]|uniref:Uncharacterized protein n=1 Tax=Gossypium mustelinum TaxID=34275 RepID=A0A5D2VT96_GOSMU|nr:hypothetical protein ERO13_D02G064450v2 [Gossypium hirsutum]TYI92567.1 hypothetical protein E1A91_D02G079300v1 [Gossypium mustelinum]